MFNKKSHKKTGYLKKIKLHRISFVVFLLPFFTACSQDPFEGQPENIRNPFSTSKEARDKVISPQNVKTVLDQNHLVFDPGDVTKTVGLSVELSGALESESYDVELIAKGASESIWSNLVYEDGQLILTLNTENLSDQFEEDEFIITVDVEYKITFRSATVRFSRRLTVFIKNPEYSDKPPLMEFKRVVQVENEEKDNVCFVFQLQGENSKQLKKQEGELPFLLNVVVVKTKNPDILPYKPNLLWSRSKALKTESAVIKKQVNLSEGEVVYCLILKKDDEVNLDYQGPYSYRVRMFHNEFITDEIPVTMNLNYKKQPVISQAKSEFFKDVTSINLVRVFDFFKEDHVRIDEFSCPEKIECFCKSVTSYEQICYVKYVPNLNLNFEDSLSGEYVLKATLVSPDGVVKGSVTRHQRIFWNKKILKERL